MKDLNLAILTPRKAGAYSETFIKNHIDNLGFNKIVIYGGPVPHKCNGVRKLTFINKIKFWIHRLLKTSKSTDPRFYDKQLLRQHLKAYKVDVVLAEYVLILTNVFLMF